MKGNANFSCPFKGLYHLKDYNFPMKQLSSAISSSLQKETNSRGHNLFSPLVVPKPPLINNHNLSYQGFPLAFFSLSFFFSLQIFHLYSFKIFTYI